MVKYILTTALLVFVFFSVNAQTLVLSEKFNTGIPSTWTMHNLDNKIPDSSVIEYADAPWIVKNNPFALITDFCASSTSYFSPEGQANRWLITEAIQLGTYGNVLNWKALSHDPSFAENYVVMISTSPEASSFTDTLKYVQLEYDSWTSHQVFISEKFPELNNSLVYIAFVLRTDSGYKFYLDDVEVYKEDPLAIENIDFVNVKVFPNPTSDYFTIQSDSQLDKTEIHSFDGKNITSQIEFSNNKFNVKSLETGTYFITLTSKNTSKTLSFIKQ